MKTVKAKHNGREVLVLYVNRSVTWALITEDVEKRTKAFKADIIELENCDKHALEELSVQNLRGGA